MAVPETYTETQILLAVDRVRAGLGFSSAKRYGSMSLGRAHDILRSAVHELIVLRQETREWVCVKCKRVFPPPTSPILLSCEHCGTMLRPAVVIVQAALLDQIEQAQAHAKRLEESLMILLENLDMAEEGSLD